MELKTLVSYYLGDNLELRARLIPKESDDDKDEPSVDFVIANTDTNALVATVDPTTAGLLLSMRKAAESK